MLVLNVVKVFNCVNSLSRALTSIFRMRAGSKIANSPAVAKKTKTNPPVARCLVAVEMLLKFTVNQTKKLL